MNILPAIRGSGINPDYWTCLGQSRGWQKPCRVSITWEDMPWEMGTEEIIRNLQFITCALWINSSMLVSTWCQLVFFFQKYITNTKYIEHICIYIHTHTSYTYTYTWLYMYIYIYIYIYMIIHVHIHIHTHMTYDIWHMTYDIWIYIYNITNK